jgi:hypothetical protein
MSKAAAQNALNRFNYEGWEAIEPFFQSFEAFYNFLVKNGLDEELDFKSIPDEYENMYMSVMLNHNPQKTLKYITDELLTDVDEEGGEYYLRLNDREELSRLFYESRNESARAAAKAVLGEDFWEPFWETTDNIYRDVYEELVPENKERLYVAILDKLKGQKIEPNTELLDVVAEEQGHPEYVELTIDVLRKVMGDDDTGEYILRQAEDVRQSLHQLHSTSYNDAYQSEVWNDVWSELGRFFDGKIIETPKQVKRADGSEITRYDTKIKIKDFPGIMRKYMDEYGSSDYNMDRLGYDYFLPTLEKMMDESVYEYLDFRVPDYPDSRKVDENINEMFGDYI